MLDKVHPIRPEDVAKEKERSFPDEAISSFNELIVQNYNSGSAIIKLEDVVALMIKKGLERADILDKGWLNVEDIYCSSGWIVECDRPGYNESYPATFVFKRKSNKMIDF